MRARTSPPQSRILLRSLADFRFELRSFLLFSEQAALHAGLQPQQHQLLLQVAGAPEKTLVTIAYAASRLGLKHNSAVELVDRSEREGLLSREEDPKDRRRIHLKVTRKAENILHRLSSEHAQELNVLAPRLIAALERVRDHATSSAGTEAK
jgi:DNA-binding MarR family transcriptional regulator